MKELHICSNIPVVARLLQQEGVSISRISALIDQSMRKSDLEDFLNRDGVPPPLRTLAEMDGEPSRLFL